MTVTGVISFPNIMISTDRSWWRTWGEPMNRTLVLSEFIKREFLQHQPQMFLESSFRLSMTVVISDEGKDK